MGQLQATRRSLLFGAAAVSAAAGLGLGASARAAGSMFAVAETTAGKVRGFVTDGIRSFKGVPYGESTAGANRFMAPVKVKPWAGVRPAYGFGPMAPQDKPSQADDYTRAIDWDRHPGAMGEDCLVLNVWTPGLADGKRRPVMVYFHGGGFFNGTGGLPGFDGDALSRFGDVVVVTVNHRLNAFGYINLADVAGARFAAAGSAGLLDLIASLEWVRDNAEAFGGDPAKVMIFGQSGGGRKVSALLAMPAAKGLFHAAAVHSGSMVVGATREDSARAAEALLKALDIPKTRAADLQKVPFEAIMDAQLSLRGQVTRDFKPVVDGRYLPQDPFDPAAPTVSADVPVMITTMLEDGANRRGPFKITAAQLADSVAKEVGAADAARVLEAYRAAWPGATPFQIQSRLLTDRNHRWRAHIQGERKAAQKRAAVYMYRFDFPSPAFGGEFGAVHGTDVELGFHNWRQLISGNTAEARRMADMLAPTLVAFARTGNPNNPAIPNWPAYTPEQRATMLFNLETHAVNDPQRELRELASSLQGSRQARDL